MATDYDYSRGNHKCGGLLGDLPALYIMATSGIHMPDG